VVPDVVARALNRIIGDAGNGNTDTRFQATGTV
jgi:hypothetical protein